MGMSVGGPNNYDDDEVAYRPLAEINITPFVDVMLVLLVIFMVAAPLLVQGVPVDLPSTSATSLQPQAKKPLIVTLDDAGALYIRQDPVDPQNLVSTLNTIRAAEGDTIVYVRAPKTRAYGDVMDLLGVVGQSGYNRVSLLSQPKTASTTPAFGSDLPAAVAE